MAALEAKTARGPKGREELFRRLKMELILRTRGDYPRLLEAGSAEIREDVFEAYEERWLAEVLFNELERCQRKTSVRYAGNS